MSKVIKDICRLEYMKGKWSYVGTLRNERKFEIGKEVFYIYDHKNKIARGKIIGVELTLDENPEYKYKIQLLGNVKIDSPIGDLKLTCSDIFFSVNQAKEAAMKHINHLYEIQKKEIEDFFEYDEKNERYTNIR